MPRLSSQAGAPDPRMIAVVLAMLAATAGRPPPTPCATPARPHAGPGIQDVMQQHAAAPPAPRRHTGWLKPPLTIAMSWDGPASEIKRMPGDVLDPDPPAPAGGSPAKAMSPPRPPGRRNRDARRSGPPPERRTGPWRSRPDRGAPRGERAGAASRGPTGSAASQAQSDRQPRRRAIPGGSRSRGRSRSQPPRNHGRVQVAVGRLGRVEGDGDRGGKHRAHRHRGPGPALGAGELGVGAKAAAGEVDRLEIAGQQLTAPRQPGRIGDHQAHRATDRGPAGGRGPGHGHQDAPEVASAPPEAALGKIADEEPELLPPELWLPDPDPVLEDPEPEPWLPDPEPVLENPEPDLAAEPAPPGSRPRRSRGSSRQGGGDRPGQRARRPRRRQQLPPTAGCGRDA